MTIGVGTLLTVTGLLCTLAGLLIGFLTFSRNRDKDVKMDASKNAVIETKLDNLSRLMDTLIADLKTNEKNWNEISKFVVRLDEKINQTDSQIKILKNQEKEE